MVISWGRRWFTMILWIWINPIPLTLNTPTTKPWFSRDFPHSRDHEMVVFSIRGMGLPYFETVLTPHSIEDQ